MKSVMLSIRPKWCLMIMRGDKTCEVRKTRPRLEPPFLCYIYASKGKDTLMGILKDGDTNFGEVYHGKPVFVKTPEVNRYQINCQHVIGEFVCDKIIRSNNYDGTLAGQIMSGELNGFKTGMRVDEMTKYVGEDDFYFWHIHSYIHYGHANARPLSQFRSWGAEPGHHMKVAPQSWCYVEEFE